MSEHTPGPWKVDSKYCVGPVSQEDDQSYGMIIPVADVYGPNRKADAELIASAPQLREQNRVLREALLKVRPELYCMDKQLIASGYKRGVSVADAMKALEAALTATSQEG